MKSREALLLLGGSQQQVVAIEAANRLGYRTVLCDYLPDNPGKDYADVFYQVSTTDKEAVLDVAKKEHIDGVLAYASDPAAPTAAYVATKLNLPTNSLDVVRILSDKALFRSYLEHEGFACPRSLIFETDCDLRKIWSAIQSFSLPVVVKPTDSSGSKGVSVIDDIISLSEAIEKASRVARNGKLIVEEYIERSYPFVVGGDIFVLEGEIVFWGLMDCIREPNSPLVPCGEMIPPMLTERQYALIQETLQKLISRLNIKFGELNVEVILGSSDVPYVLELGARSGGNLIPLELADASGQDLISANIICAMGGVADISPWRSSGSTRVLATYVLHASEEGRYEGYSLSCDLADRLYRSVWYKRKGVNVFRFDSASEALGVLFFDFPNQEMMYRSLVCQSSAIKIKIVKD